MSTAPGSRLGAYELQSRLGEGGMGEVWKAYDPKLRRTVAIKVLKSRLPASGSELQAPGSGLSASGREPAAGSRLLSEARAASALNHPHICTIYEVGEAESTTSHDPPGTTHDSPSGSTPFIVMEYVEGQPLSELIPPDGLPPETLIRYGTQIADALAHAHAHGVVHRDLKSANVVITPDGRAKVLDFGVADRLPDADAEALTQTFDSPRTSHQAPSLVGTLAYMAPEVLRGEKATERSDIWALGVLLYEMASGKPPFSGATQTQVVSAIATDSPSPLSSRLMPALRTITERALAKQAGHRYGTAAEVRAALEALQSGLRMEATASAGESTPSIAVLPFTNMSSDPEQEYFCDGIAEDITSALAKVDRLRVAGRTSAFSFKGKQGDLREIGRTLDVGVVLEGSVRRAGNRLRITAELVKVSDGYHLWSERYDRQLEDIFDVQDEIALAVVEALKVTLLGEEKNAVLSHATENPEAYQLCLQARHAWYRWTDEGFSTAIKLFEQALETDPKCAVAHFGLGDCRLAGSVLGREAPDTPKVRAHMEMALRLDPDLAEAHAVLGAIVEGFHEWNWSAAESRCRKALTLDPRCAHAWSLFSYLMSATERHDQSLDAARRAVELDPLNPFWNTTLLLSFLAKGDREAALRQAHTTLDLAPDYWRALFFAGQIWMAAGQHDEAVAAFERGVASSGGVAVLNGLLANALAKTGRRDEARRLSTLMRERARSRFVPPVALALAHVSLDERDEAFSCMERGLENPDFVLMEFLTWCPALDHLRADPRFAHLRRRIGL